MVQHSINHRLLFQRGVDLLAVVIWIHGTRCAALQNRPNRIVNIEIDEKSQNKLKCYVDKSTVVITAVWRILSISARTLLFETDWPTLKRQNIINFTFSRLLNKSWCLCALVSAAGLLWVILMVSQSSDTGNREYCNFLQRLLRHNNAWMLFLAIAIIHMRCVWRVKKKEKKTVKKTMQAIMAMVWISINTHFNCISGWRQCQEPGMQANATYKSYSAFVFFSTSSDFVCILPFFHIFIFNLSVCVRLCRQSSHEITFYVNYNFHFQKVSTILASLNIHVWLFQS